MTCAPPPPAQRPHAPDQPRRRTRPARPKIYDIFEGTEQIQQLVIARAISGLRIE
jgi:hypothetical protein